MSELVLKELICLLQDWNRFFLSVVLIIFRDFSFVYISK